MKLFFVDLDIVAKLARVILRDCHIPHVNLKQYLAWTWRISISFKLAFQMQIQKQRCTFVTMNTLEFFQKVPMKTNGQLLYSPAFVSILKLWIKSCTIA